MTTQETTIHAYAASITALDADAFVACFSPNCRIEDPVGGPPATGHDGARAFFTGFLPIISSIECRVGKIFATGNSVAFTWTMDARGAGGQTARVEGIDVFVFDQNGKILGSQGYWDAGSFVAALTAS